MIIYDQRKSIASRCVALRNNANSIVFFSFTLDQLNTIEMKKKKKKFHRYSVYLVDINIAL